MRTIRAQVHGMAWHHRTGFYYNYRMEHAPWVKPRMAFDLELPAHLDAFLAAEVTKHEPIEVTDGKTVQTFYPRLDTWEMVKLATGPYNYAVRVSFVRAGEQDGHFAVYYEVDHSPDFLAAHEAHRAAVEGAIPPSLEDRGNTPHHTFLRHGPIPHGHPLKHPESRPA